MNDPDHLLLTLAPLAQVSYESNTVPVTIIFSLIAHSLMLAKLLRDTSSTHKSLLYSSIICFSPDAALGSQIATRKYLSSQSRDRNLYNIFNQYSGRLERSNKLAPWLHSLQPQNKMIGPLESAHFRRPLCLIQSTPQLHKPRHLHPQLYLTREFSIQRRHRL